MAYRCINQNTFEVTVGGKTISPSGYAVVQTIPVGVPSEIFNKLTFTLINDPLIDDASAGYEAAVGLGSSSSSQGAAADNVLTSILSSSTRMGQVAQATRTGSNGGTISSSRSLTASDDGKQYTVTTALTITIPAGLSPMPSVIFLPPSTGNLTIAVSGGATINGATTSLTRNRASNPLGIAIQAWPETDAYGVSGV